MSELVLKERDGAVLKLTLNRPEAMNAYNVPLHLAMMDAYAEAEADSSIRAIVLTGAGKAFCAGADISDGFEGAGFSSSPPKIDGIARDYGGMLNIFTFEMNTPIIAAINGHAVGIGATMLLPLDIKIASEKTKMAFPFSKRGIVYDGAASYFLPRIVGMSRAQELILTGRTFLAAEAKEMGMIHEVAEHGTVLERAMEIARDIAVNVSPTSAANNKALLRASILGDNRYGDGPMSAHMAESALLEKAFVSPDCKEGVQSFFEKRPPKFADYKPG